MKNVSRFEDGELHIMVENGETALAAISMDGIQIGKARRSGITGFISFCEV